jgi:hypothetical protein
MVLNVSRNVYQNPHAPRTLTLLNEGSTAFQAKYRKIEQGELRIGRCFVGRTAE